MRFAFLVPPGEGPGTRYARDLSEALRASGHDAGIAGTAPPGVIPIFDAAAIPQQVPSGAVVLVHRAPMNAWNAGAFRRVIATSARVLERLAEAGIEAQLVAPGVRSLPRSDRSEGPRCAILAVGAITPRKGHTTLLRALARLADLDWTLTIAGTSRPYPEHASAVAALAAELGIGERTRLVPDPGDDALDALWQGADLFALASAWEGFAMSLAEALRRGIPAAVSDAAAASLPPLAEAGWGITCAADDAEGFSKAMRRLIYDRDLRRDLAEGAWHAGQALPSWERQAARFVSLVEAAG